MNSDAQDEVEKVQEEGHQLLNLTFAQEAALPENRAYLDGCSTVTAFKTDKYLKGIKTLTCCAHGNNLYGQWRKYIRIR